MKKVAKSEYRWEVFSELAMQIWKIPASFNECFWANNANCLSALPKQLYVISPKIMCADNLPKLKMPTTPVTV